MYQRGNTIEGHGPSRSGTWIDRILCALPALLLFAPALASAASDPHGGGGGLISFDKSLIVQGVNFLALLLILNYLLYKPLVAKMQERTAAIQKSLEEAQAARAEAARQQEENAARLRSAYQEAAAIREQALKEAAEEQRKLVDAAQAEARRLVETARAQTEAEIRRARDELRREVSGLAVAVAEKLVRRSLRDEDHRRIVDDTIAKIGA
jgi:F-type H+-transporting ATPase subunit b